MADPLIVYEVWQAADVEGRESYCVLRTNNEALADGVAKSGFGNRSMGSGPGSVRTHTVFQTATELFDALGGLITAEQEVELRALLGFPLGNTEVIRRRALAKLSPAERAALGVK